MVAEESSEPRGEISHNTVGAKTKSTLKLRIRVQHPNIHLKIDSPLSRHGSLFLQPAYNRAATRQPIGYSCTNLCAAPSRFDL